MSRKRDPRAHLTRYGEAPGGGQPVEVPKCDRLWTVQDVSEFLGVPVTTLHQWRYLGSGPEAFKVGRHLRYDPDAVRRWLVEDCRPDRSA